MTERIVIGHPVLNDNVRHAALSLAEAGMLERFHTGLDATALRTDTFGRLGAELRRRTLPPAVHARTTSHPVGELARLMALRVPRRINPFDPHLGPLSIQARAQAIDRILAKALQRPGVTAVYAYEDGAADAFASARDHGRRAIYDLPIGYWRVGRELFEEEAERRPAWRSTLSGLRDPEWKLDRKDKELELATDVIVASSFTARTLDLFPGTIRQVTVIPYGAPPRVPVAPQAHGGPIRVIYVGSLSQRKGLADLLEAIPIVGASVEMTIVGQRVGVSAERDAALEHARWFPSLPHQELLNLIAFHDVLVLPSLFEGFGLVLTEALSQGTPIIATDHTAAPDLLEGIEDAGWVVPIRNSEAIALAIGRLADADFRMHSRERARLAADRRPWAAYRTGVTTVAQGEGA